MTPHRNHVESRSWQRETSQQMASCEIGRGRTEREAIDDLMAQIEERFA